MLPGMHVTWYQNIIAFIDLWFIVYLDSSYNLWLVNRRDMVDLLNVKFYVVNKNPLVKPNSWLMPWISQAALNKIVRDRATLQYSFPKWTIILKVFNVYILKSRIILKLLCHSYPMLFFFHRLFQFMRFSYQIDKMKF